MKKLDEPDEPEEIEDDEEEDPLAEAEDTEASLDEIVAKAPEVDLEEEEESVLDLTREERLESLSIRAVPKQANEFVCASCHLVKHNSQLADRNKQLCRDCV